MASPIPESRLQTWHVTGERMRDVVFDIDDLRPEEFDHLKTCPACLEQFDRIVEERFRP